MLKHVEDVEDYGRWNGEFMIRKFRVFAAKM